MRKFERAGLFVSAAAAVAITAACSDATTGPSVTPKLTNPSFITVDQIPAGFAPEAGKIKVCKVWDNPTAGTIPNTTVASVGNDVTPNAATLSVIAGPYVLGHNQCANVATSTESSGIFDEVTLTETVPGNSNLVTVQRFDFGGASSTIANGSAIGFNTFHGTTVVFTNHLTPPPPPPPPAVCDFSTFGGFVLEPNNVSYGGNAGFASEGFAYGSLNFVNHTTGDHIHVWNVTTYEHPASGPLSGDPDSRLASGMGTINGAGSFPVEFRFVDNGEPGVNDRVYLKVNGVVLIPEQVVQGGNIQLHATCKKAPKAEKH